jgi:predicted acetyltransferase
MSTYRAVPADRRERYREILHHAFAIDQGPRTRDTGTGSDDATADADEWPPALSDPRGTFEDDRLVSVCKLYYLDAVVHDSYATIGGLGGVATPPEHRREGHVRQLAAGALEEYRDNGVGLVALWPFSTPFYRNLGWGVANKYTRYELPPAQLAFARDAPGTMRRLEPDDWDRLRPVERAYGEGTALSLRRSEQWWRDRTLAAWPGDTAPYIYGYERDGQLRGYVLYTVESGDDGPRLRVTDLAHADSEAYRGLLGFLSDHDSQVGTIVLRRAAETELLDRVPDPGRVECAVETGPMIRLTDVAEGLERYPWPDDVDARFTLAVADPLLDRNDGLFDVAVADGMATASPVDGGGEAGESGGDADASIDVTTLSQLYVGSHGLRDAERFGELTVRREALREPLSAAFPGRSVCLREFF